MKRARLLVGGLLAATLPLGVAAQAGGGQAGGGQQAAPAVARTHLKVGDMAPDFTLPSTAGGPPVKLSDFRGKKNVVLAFYVLAFTGG